MINSWIISANENKFKIVECLSQNNYVDWTQNNMKVQIGDIIYMYISGKEGRIRYKMEVAAINLPTEVYMNNPDYWVNNDMLAKGLKKSRYMRLALVKDLGANNMLLNMGNLRNHGLVSNLQGRMKVSGDLLQYIEQAFKGGKPMCSESPIENPMVIQQLLYNRNKEFDKAENVKMVRHTDKKEHREHLIIGQPYKGTLTELYEAQPGLFNLYQNEQKVGTFDGVDFLVSFMGAEGKTARFIGVYKIKGICCTLPNGRCLYDIEEIPGFEDLKDNVYIDWGDSCRTWLQSYGIMKLVIQ